MNEDFFVSHKKSKRNSHYEDLLKKRIYDLETALVQIKELCGKPTPKTPLEIHMIIELCTDNLKK